MRTILLRELEANPSLYRDIAKVLEDGGLVCHPSAAGYKLVVDLGSPEAVTAMLQAKRRVGNAPALVFLPEKKWVAQVAETVTEDARKLMRAFWPGSVTLLFAASQELDPKVRKPLTKAKGWLGVRVPDDPICLAVVRAFGRPLLVSSANLAAKGGEHSLAQVKKNFGRALDLLVEAGDLAPGGKSTLVDVTSEKTAVVRAGEVSEEQVRAALAG